MGFGLFVCFFFWSTHLQFNFTKVSKRIIYKGSIFLGSVEVSLFGVITVKPLLLLLLCWVPLHVPVALLEDLHKQKEHEMYVCGGRDRRT